MATVRFSGQLQDDIVRNAGNMFDDNIKQAKNNYPDDWGKKLYDSLFSADIQAKMNALPNGFFEKIESLSLTGFKNAPEDVWQTSTTKVETWRRVNLRLQLPSPLPFPPKKLHLHLLSTPFDPVKIGYECFEAIFFPRSNQLLQFSFLRK